MISPNIRDLLESDALAPLAFLAMLVLVLAICLPSEIYKRTNQSKTKEKK